MNFVPEEVPWTRLWSQAKVREEDKPPWCQVSRSQEAWQEKDLETGPRCWTPTVQELPWMQRPSHRSSCPSWLVAPPTTFLLSFCLTPRGWMESKIISIRQWIWSNYSSFKNFCWVPWADWKIFVVESFMSSLYNVSNEQLGKCIFI